MDKFSLRKFRWLIIGMLILLVGTTSGCEAFRRKFTRKKKEDPSQSQAGVIFDPIDYPDIVKSPAEIYRQHYSLWKVWQSDLPIVLENDANEKKVRYVLGQMKEQLTAMRALLKEEVRSSMDPYLNEIDSLSLEFDKSAVFRNKVDILSRIQKLGRDVRNHCSPDKMAASLVNL